MSFYEILDILTYLIPILLFLGISAGIYYFKFIKFEYRFLLFYLTLCFVTDILGRVLGTLYDNNLILIIVFSFFELLFFSIFYQVCLYKRKILPYIVASTVSTLYILWEIISLWNTPPNEFQTYSRTLSSFLIIIMAINYLFEKIENKHKSNNIVKLNSVIIIFFSLHLIFYLPINFLINVPSSIKYYFWCANFFLIIAFYIYLGREIWRNGLTQKQLHSGL